MGSGWLSNAKRVKVARSIRPDSRSSSVSKVELPGERFSKSARHFAAGNYRKKIGRINSDPL